MESISLQVRREFSRKIWIPALIALPLSTLVAIVSYTQGYDIINVGIAAWFTLTLVFQVAHLLVTLKQRQKFWRDFARDKGWSYELQGSLSTEQGVMFTQGNTRAINNVVKGTWAGRVLEIFEYEFAVGGKHYDKTYAYTVFDLHFRGRFPHLYLDNHLNAHSAKKKISLRNFGKRISLPLEFSYGFHLYGPPEYEIEALEIFTPDLLQYLLDSAFPYDLELVDQELLVFAEGSVDNRLHLETKFKIVEELLGKLTPVLDHVSFEPIGHHPHTLR